MNTEDRDLYRFKEFKQTQRFMFSSQIGKENKYYH